MSFKCLKAFNYIRESPHKREGKFCLVYKVFECKEEDLEYVT